MSSGVPNPVTATFSGRFFASATRSFQVLMGLPAGTKNADGCLIMMATGVMSENFQFGLPAAWVPKVSPVMIEIV